MARSRALSQCLDIQNLAYETAMEFKTLESGEDAMERHARKCAALAQVTKAWESAANRARILRGRPLPGILKPPAKKPKRRSEADYSPWSPAVSVKPTPAVQPPGD